MNRLLLLFAGLLLVAAPLRGQSPLDRIERQTDDGAIQEARAGLEAWWERDRPSASRADLQHAIWLRGILTLEPELAEMDFQRLVLEFPGGPYSDRALLRLAQGAHAADDLPAAAGYYRHLLRDYPGSRLRGEAEAWLEELGDAGGAPESAPTARAPAPTQPSGGGRPARGTGEGAGTETGARGGAGTPARGAAETESERRQAWAIQLGAFADVEGAERLAAEAREAGIDVRLVRVEGSGLVRVRTGGFPSRDAVQPALDRVRRLGFDGFAVSDAVREARVR